MRRDSGEDATTKRILELTGEVVAGREGILMLANIKGW